VTESQVTLKKSLVRLGEFRVESDGHFTVVHWAIKILSRYKRLCAVTVKRSCGGYLDSLGVVIDSIVVVLLLELFVTLLLELFSLFLFIEHISIDHIQIRYLFIIIIVEQPLSYFIFPPFSYFF
jgi:hypothetical protein